MEPINLYVFLTTLVPIAAYLIYIYIRDEYKKEPFFALFIAVMFTIGTVLGYFCGLAKLHNKFYFYFDALVAAIVVNGFFCSLLLWIDYQASLYVVAIVVLVILGVVMHGLTHGIGIEHLIISDSEKGKTND